MRRPHNDWHLNTSVWHSQHGSRGFLSDFLKNSYNFGRYFSRYFSKEGRYFSKEVEQCINMIKNNPFKWAWLDVFTECYTQWASIGSHGIEWDHSKMLRQQSGCNLGHRFGDMEFIPSCLLICCMNYVWISSVSSFPSHADCKHVWAVDGSPLALGSRARTS